MVWKDRRGWCDVELFGYFLKKIEVMEECGGLICKFWRSFDKIEVFGRFIFKVCSVCILVVVMSLDND